MREQELDETTDYRRLLSVLAAFDPQQVDTTPSIATPWDAPEPRIKLANRVSFIFSLDGGIVGYMGLKGESVNLLPGDSPAADGESDYQKLLGVLSVFSEQDVRNDPNAAGGPRITLSKRGTFCFSPDGKIRGYFDSAEEKNVYVRPGGVAPRTTQATPEATPQPLENLEPQRLRMPGPQQAQQVPQQVPLANPDPGQQATAAAPWSQQSERSKTQR